MANRAFERLIRIVGILNIGCAVYGLKAMLNSVGSLIELEVQLQHQRAVAGDGAGLFVFLVRRIVDVLVAILRELIAVFNGNFRVRGAFALIGTLERIAVRVLIVELNGVLGVGVRRPDGVEDVVAFFVYKRLCAGGEGGSGAIGGGVPAREGVARLAEAGILFGEKRDGRVVHQLIDGFGFPCAVVGVVGHADLGFEGYVNSRQGYVSVHGDVAAGIVVIVIRVLPMGEYVRLGRGKGAGLHLGLGVGAVVAGIEYIRARARTRRVGQAVGRARENGGDGHVAVKLGGGVDALTGIRVHPLEQNQIVRGDGVIRSHVHIRIRKASARNNVLCAIIDIVVGYLDGDCNNDFRLLPYGVETQPVIGHFRAREGIRGGRFGNLRRIDSVPALKLRTVAEACRARGSRALVIQRRAVLERLGRYIAVVVLFQNVAVALVIQEVVILRGAIGADALRFHTCGGHAGNGFLAKLIAICICILRILGGFVVIRPVIALSILPIFRAGPIEALEHIVQMYKIS